MVNDSSAAIAFTVSEGARTRETAARTVITPPKLQAEVNRPRDPGQHRGKRVIDSSVRRNRVARARQPGRSSDLRFIAELDG
jgi:hypothetical protein